MQKGLINRIFFMFIIMFNEAFAAWLDSSKKAAMAHLIVIFFHYLLILWD